MRRGHKTVVDTTLRGHKAQDGLAGVPEVQGVWVLGHVQHELAPFERAIEVGVFP
jgi:hypothetical protein